MYQLHIPKGRQFKIELEDGTKVWLNAGAKLSYPSRFNENYREVELEGEAYFEVAKQTLTGGDQQIRRKPFFVRSSKQVISVLGTHFNVEANKGEEYSRTSLAEGVVEVIKANRESKTLKPGQQSVVNEKSAIKIVPVDLEMVLGWKNNLFVFHNSSLREILQEVERWYDIKIEIDTWPTEKFYGEIQRNSPLSEVLKLIEMSSDFRFKVVYDGVERRLLMQ
nr:FecR family protein [Sphingobacterium bovistauri]